MITQTLLSRLAASHVSSLLSLACPHIYIAFFQDGSEPPLTKCERAAPTPDENALLWTTVPYVSPGRRIRLRASRLVKTHSSMHRRAGREKQLFYGGVVSPLPCTRPITLVHAVMDESCRSRLPFGNWHLRAIRWRACRRAGRFKVWVAFLVGLGFGGPKVCGGYRCAARHLSRWPIVACARSSGQYINKRPSKGPFDVVQVLVRSWRALFAAAQRGRRTPSTASDAVLVELVGFCWVQSMGMLRGNGLGCVALSHICRLSAMGSVTSAAC